MFLGILFFLAFLILGAFLGDKSGEWLERRFHLHEGHRASQTLFLLVFLVACAIPSFTTWFVEFPSLFGKPSVATFDQDGNLVYHKWGLYTPRGLEVVNINEGERWVIVNDRSTNRYVLLAKDSWIYQVTFRIEMTMSDPKVFYSIRGRRRQGVGPGSVFNEEIKREFIRTLVRNHMEMEKVFNKDCISTPPLDNGDLDVNSMSCAAIEKSVADSLPSMYFEDQGVKIKITSHIETVQRM